MKNRIIIIVTILGCAALLPLLLLHRVSAQSPAIEIACPAGATALPAGVIINPVNGKIRQLLCMDSSGNLNLPSTITGSGPFNATSAGSAAAPIYSFSAFPSGLFLSGSSPAISANGTLVMFWGSTLATLSVNLQYKTVAFASIGAVPAAGIAQYCTDCTTAATCAGAGSGHLAVSNGTNWTCQ